MTYDLVSYQSSTGFADPRLDETGCPTLERFSNSRALNDSKESGFFFHPSDEDLSPGTPTGKSHSAVVLSVYSNWRTAIA
jgi:hypothetical protein